MTQKAIKVIKASERNWAREASRVEPKPNWLLANEIFVPSEEEQRQRSEQADEALRAAFSREIVDVFKPLPSKFPDDPLNFDRYRVTRELGLTAAVLDKWDEFRVRHATKHPSLKAYINTSQPESVDPMIREAMRYLYNAKRVEVVEQRFFWLDAHTSVHLLIIADTIVDFVTFRGLRELRKLMKHKYKEWQISNVSEAERYADIGKQTFRRKIQGGLMRGKLSPRVRRK